GRPAQLLGGEREAPGDLLLRFAAHPLGLLVRPLDEHGLRRLPFRQAAGAHLGEISVELGHPLVDLGLQADGFLAALPGFPNPLLDRLLTAAKGPGERARDEISEEPEEPDEVGELPDPHRHPEKPFRFVLGGAERGHDGQNDCHATSFRPRTFSARTSASRRTRPGSSAEESSASAAISRVARSRTSVAPARACASFFSRCACPSPRSASRTLRASTRARESSASARATSAFKRSRLSACTRAAVASSFARSSRIAPSGRKRNFL